MVEVRTIADGFLNYTKATAISLNGIRLLCYLGILCQVALTDHSTRKIPGRYHIYILLIAAADMVLTGNSDLYNRIPGAAAVAGIADWPDQLWRQPISKLFSICRKSILY